jgi:hypothetical protein
MNQTETAVRTALGKALKAGIKAAFEQGRLLTVASEALSKKERDPGWEHQTTFADWYAQFGISQGQVSRLMKMYGNEPLRLRFEHSHVNLPQDQMSLYQLARIDEDKLKALFDEDDKLIAAGAEHGVIHSGMSRDEAHQVALKSGVEGKAKSKSDGSNTRMELAQTTAQLDQTIAELEAAQRHAADLEAANQALRESNPAWDQDGAQVPLGDTGGQSPAIKPASPATTVSAAILTVPADELVKLLLTRDDITDVIRELAAHLPVTA